MDRGFIEIRLETGGRRDAAPLPAVARPRFSSGTGSNLPVIIPETCNRYRVPLRH